MPRLCSQAQDEATAIQTESAETNTLAAKLRADAAQLNVEVADTEGNIAVYEQKVGGRGGGGRAAMGRQGACMVAGARV